MINYGMKSGDQLSQKSIFIWRSIQSTIWLIGVFIVLNLIFNPELGLHLFWNILIPVAPLLLIVAVGIWRNVCPMATTALFLRHIGLTKRKKLSIPQSGKLNFYALVALFIIVPLRHSIFDLNGLATAILILSLAVIAILLSFFYEWKSAWCSGLCPIHSVEKLYGLKPKLELPNAHCNQCYKCVNPCPDSTPGITPSSSNKTNYHKLTGLLTIGAFPGFVWGWFQVQDYSGTINIDQLISIYTFPIIGALVTSIIYLLLKRYLKKRILTELFSATAVSCYYWFRIPALFGFGKFPGDGMLIDLTGSIPGWTIDVVVIGFTMFFFWWLVLSKRHIYSWAVRPEFAITNNKINK